MPRAGPQPPLPGSHVHVLCAWRKAWRRCSHQLTMSPPGRGTVEKEGRLSVWDCVFSQQAGIYHICNLKHQCRGTFPAVHTFTAGGMGLIPGWGPEIPHAIRCRKKRKKYQCLQPTWQFCSQAHTQQERMYFKKAHSTTVHSSQEPKQPRCPLAGGWINKLACSQQGVLNTDSCD